VNFSYSNLWNFILYYIKNRSINVIILIEGGGI